MPLMNLCPKCSQPRYATHNGMAHCFNGKTECESPVRPIDRAYEGQAHHMAKAANSLILLLTNLDYSVFPEAVAASLTTDVHRLISRFEYLRPTYPVRRSDGQVVQVTVPEREE